MNKFPSLQVLPVDLTRAIDPKTDLIVNTTNAPRKLAFSVENILDPNKFTGRKADNCDISSANDRNNNNQTLYPTANGAYGPGDEENSQVGK